MTWDLQEAIGYYQSKGAPGDQTALVSLLKEIQQEQGGLSKGSLAAVAEACRIKESFLLAIIKRIPSLHVKDTHTLELCGGPNCPRRADLAGFVRKTYGEAPPFELRITGCMHQCGKGPNLKWDGVLYHAADEALLRRLIGGEN